MWPRPTLPLQGVADKSKSLPGHSCSEREWQSRVWSLVAHVHLPLSCTRVVQSWIASLSLAMTGESRKDFSSFLLVSRNEKEAQAHYYLLLSTYYPLTSLRHIPCTDAPRTKTVRVPTCAQRPTTARSSHDTLTSWRAV